MILFAQTLHLDTSSGAGTISRISSENVSLVFVLVFGLVIGLAWWWNRRAKKWLKENGRDEPEPDALGWLLGSLPQSSDPTSLRYSADDFQEMVSKAMDEIPADFDEEWKNVVVVVSTECATDADKKRMGIGEDRLVLGTYSGVSRTQGLRSEHSSHVITIYQPAIEQVCGGDKERVEEQIRKTVRHELAHHLGMSHTQMRDVGL